MSLFHPTPPTRLPTISHSIRPIGHDSSFNGVVTHPMPAPFGLDSIETLQGLHGYDCLSGDVTQGV
ncbi:hypothetical protein JAAARDRAFT_34468 [Jaapia argillacea MUCL 33604]|uniref:Uncharacterized protein n=1 Tax=Jaapia argillacea MUCL 33604 TaxID=933084 RepID=A0A067Q574_9AGAM|nr:hypothetical protein JAAARDRAFT_34468 [Jaapia argillacea MUCL 33604]